MFDQEKPKNPIKAANKQKRYKKVVDGKVVSTLYPPTNAERRKIQGKPVEEHLMYPKGK